MKSLKYSKEGEIFIPKIPSFRITDLVKAITSKKKFKITGIRPGEKLHEELISVYEGYSSVEFKNHYVINSEIFGKHNKNEYKLKNFEYNSSTNEHFLKEHQIRIVCEKLKLI